MPQIALDCLTQKLRASDALLPDSRVDLFKDLNGKIEQDRLVGSFGSKQ